MAIEDTMDTAAVMPDTRNGIMGMPTATATHLGGDRNSRPLRSEDQQVELTSWSCTFVLGGKRGQDFRADGSRLLTHFIKQNLRQFQILCFEALSEPAVDRSENIA